MAMQISKDKYRKFDKAALDSAIAEVVREEYKRISEELILIVLPRITEYALKQLARLRNGEMPNYDQWIAPFYLSWYQPG